MHNVSSIEDFDFLWELWNDFVFAALDTYFPKLNCKRSNRPPWIFIELTKEIRENKTMWRCIKKSKTPENVEKFRKFRQKIKNRLRAERRNYVKNISDEIHRNSKRFWSYFSFKSKKKPIPEKVTFQLSDWKRANVSPFFKKGKKDIVDNYRPVSLLPVISKVQERCMASRLVPHVKELLYPFQHGFQKGRSCVTQLLEAFYDIGGALDRGIETDIIYLDFAKAFDSVCPAKLVSKLSTFGIKTLY